MNDENRQKIICQTDKMSRASQKSNVPRSEHSENLRILSKDDVFIEKGKEKNSLSSKVMKGIEYFRREDQDESLGFTQVSHDFENARKQIFTLVKELSPAEAAPFLEVTFDTINNIFNKQEKLIQDILKVRSKREAWKQTLYRSYFNGQAVTRLKISLNKLMNSFYKHNEFNTEYLNQARIQQQQKKINQLKMKINQLVHQNKQLSDEFLKNVGSDRKEEFQLSQASTFRSLQQEDKRLKDRQNDLLEKIAALQKRESSHQQQIWKLQHSMLECSEHLEKALASLKESK